MSMVTGEMEARMKRNHDRGIKSYPANAYILLHLIRSGVRVFYKTFALRLYGEALQEASLIQYLPEQCYEFIGIVLQ
jgi:hypothetical protein